MALYKYSSNLSKSDATDFDKTQYPGSEAEHPGIYKCTACGDEIAIAGGHTLPPQNHRQHPPASGPIRWQLIVYAQSYK